MRRVILMCLAAVLLTAGFAAAATVWSPADPNVIAAGFSNWDIAGNWTNGLPGDVDQKPVFTSASDAVECQVTTNTLGFTSNLSLGEGGSTNAVLRVMDGGTVTKANTGGDWCAIGYNSTGRLIVEEGGTVIFGSHLWMGLENGGIGTLDLNGGYVDIDDALDVGRKAPTETTPGGLGYINLNEGILRFRYYSDASDTVGSLCDIRWGTLAIENSYTGDTKTRLDARIAAGTLVGFGGKGALTITREPFDGATLTLVRAIHPLAPFSPGYKETVLNLAGTVPLSWTALDPNAPGDSVLHTVTFGTDPNKTDPSNTVLLTNSPLTTVNATGIAVEQAGGPYYWWVDTDNGADEVIEGDMFIFYVTNDTIPTVVIDTPDTVTWPNQPVQLNATVTDSGTSPLTIAWTSNPAGAVFSPNAGVEDPTVTLGTAAGDVIITCTVSDTFNPGQNSDTMLLNVAADACAASVIAGANYPMDVDDNCVVNLADLAVVAKDWLTDYALVAPTPIP